MSSVLPLSPDQLRNKPIPDVVIQAVNALLLKAPSAGSIHLKLSDVKIMVKEHAGGELEDWWLDFEPLYQKFGWQVKFCRSGYNEDYGEDFESYYLFTPTQTSSSFSER